MRSPNSGLLDSVLGWGCLYRADTVIPLGAFGLGTGVAALPVLGVFVCVGIGFRQSRVCVAAKFWCSPIICRAFGWWDWFQSAFALFGVGGVAVLWLAWALWGVFLVHCVLCCA